VTYVVYQFFLDDTYEKVGEGLDGKAAVERAKDFTQRPAATVGIIQRVIITNDGDQVVFEWQHGKGIVFPPGFAEQELKPPEEPETSQ
jgi:hypothetical protein